MDLHNNPIFKNLNPAEIRTFVSYCREVEFTAGTKVISRGEVSRDVFFLITGELSVRLSGHVRELELDRLSPPAVVGEMSMLTGKPRSASVVATTAVKLLSIPNEVFHEKMVEGDAAVLKVIGNLARVLAVRLGALTDKLIEIESIVPGERADELQEFRAQLFSDWST
jgi:CRP-like cAMP-binding protein